MMEGYLGKTLSRTEHGAAAAMMLIEHYGQIQGDHHRAWVLDQVARVLKGTPLLIYVASWQNGEQEERIEMADPPSSEYTKWVESMRDGEDGAETYSYDIGIAP